MSLDIIAIKTDSKPIRNEENAMNTQTKEMIKGWLTANPSSQEIETLARWMRDSLRIGGVKICHSLIQEALA